MGLFVDGAFIKSWFRTNDEALASQAYVDPRDPSTTSPLMYMGLLNGLELQGDEVCEMWLGPCGVHFYHIHKRDDPRWDSFASGNPIARNTDPGRVYVRFTTSQVDWVMLCLRTTMLYFPRAQRYAPEITINRGPGVPEYFHDMDDAAREEAERICALPDTKNLGIPINVAFEQRFMAKLALGFGYTILGPQYLETDYAQRLRGALWEQDLGKRAAFGLRGLSFITGANSQVGNLIGWPGAYTFWFIVTDDTLIMVLHLPSTRAMQMTISTEPSLWQHSQSFAYHQGMVYFVLPQVRRFVGPVSLVNYLSHRSGTTLLPELEALEALRVDPATIPACR